MKGFDDIEKDGENERPKIGSTDGNFEKINDKI
jgi:hypothetical protein